MSELLAWQMDGWLIWQRNEKKSEWWNIGITRTIAENKRSRRRFSLGWNGERFSENHDYHDFRNSNPAAFSQLREFLKINLPPQTESA